MNREPITFVCVTKPWLDRLRVLLPKVLPYIDRAVLITGEEDPATIEYLGSLGPKVENHYFPWTDNFARSWNHYLEHVHDGWIILLDDDEVPSDDLLKVLRPLADTSEHGEHFCCVEFRANPISEGQDLGPCNYWRQVFFRRVPGMHYRGGTKTGCHQYIVGYQNDRLVRRDEVYYHIKSLREEYQHASRNYFTYGIWLHGSADGIQREEWYELKEILSRVYPDVKYFPDLDRMLTAGNIHPDLKEWMVRRYNQYRDHNEYNEFRALVVYFFVYLHPEEAEAAGFVK